MSDCKCGFGASIPGFGTPGATFIPKVTETADAVQLSWENNRGLSNPEPVNIPRGKNGLSAYEVAKANGFEGTEAEWLESLPGDPGKSAYEYARDGGYTGTEEEFAAKLAEEYPTPDLNAAEGEPGHVLNRTHWAETETLTYDGNLESAESIQYASNMWLIKVSDKILKKSDLVGRPFTACMGGAEETIVIDEVSLLELSDMGISGSGFAYYNQMPWIVCLASDVTNSGITVTSGTYFIHGVEADGSDMAFYAKSLQIESVQKLDEKYLPDSIGVNTTPYVLEGVSEGVANLTSGGSYISPVTDGGIWKQLKRGIIAFTFMHKSEDGTENVTATVNMLAGEVFTEDSYTRCLAYGLYEHRLSGSTTLYLARATLEVNAGNESAGALVTFNITPIRSLSGTNDTSRYPVVYDEMFIPYRIYVDANGALAVKKLTE